MFSFFCCVTLHAQDTLQIDTVAVQSSRAGKATSPRQTFRVGSSQLQSAPVHSADDYLDYIPWLDLRSRGTLGVQGDLSIRGAGYEQTLIMLDGVAMTDAQTGHHNLNLPIAPEMIDGIEIIASGASRVFGPKAMSGTVNFTTKLPEKTGGWVSLNGGEYGFYRAAAGVSLYKNGWGLSLSGQKLGSAGYATNTDFFYNSLFLQLYRKMKYGKVRLNLSSGEKGFGAQNFYSAAFPNQYENLTTRIATLVWELKKGPWEWYGNLAYRKNTDMFQLFRQGGDWYRPVGNRFVKGTDTTPAWYTGHNYHYTNTYGAMFNATRKMGVHSISAGLELRREQVYSNVLGEPIPGAPFHPFDLYTRKAGRDNISIYIEDHIKWRKWVIAGGFLLNHNSQFGNDIYPGVEASFKVNQKATIYAQVNRANRFPTYTDLYYNRGGAVGSKNLKPEEAICYEIGYTRRKSNLFLQTAAFVRDGKNLIDWVRLPGSAVTTATNLTNVLYYGADGMMSYKPPGEAGKHFTRINLGGMIMGATNTSDGFESNYALDFITNKITLSADISLSRQMQLNVIAYRQARTGGYVKPGQSFETRFEPMFSADLRWVFKAEGWNLFAETTNVFNAMVMDLGNVLLPGRWFKSGISVRF